MEMDLRGITKKEFKTLLVRLYGWKCQICKNKETDLVLDHDHSNGYVRGLLCPGCNKALGFLKENPNIFAKKYLESNFSLILGCLGPDVIGTRLLELDLSNPSRFSMDEKWILEDYWAENA